MGGGARLILVFAFVLFVVAAVCAGVEVQTAAPSGPPKAEMRPVTENLHGTKIVDPYRWLEDGTSADTQKWDAEEMAYTRSLLDPLPRRGAIHKRLSGIAWHWEHRRAADRGKILLLYAA